MVILSFEGELHSSVICPRFGCKERLRFKAMTRDVLDGQNKAKANEIKYSLFPKGFCSQHSLPKHVPLAEPPQYVVRCNTALHTIFMQFTSTLCVCCSSDVPCLSQAPKGILRQNWNDTEKISMAPAQG